MANGNGGRQVPDLALRTPSAIKQGKQEEFRLASEVFEALARSVCSRERSAPALPGFRLTDDIVSAMDRAHGQCNRDEVGLAFDTMAGAKSHLNSKRALWLRRLFQEAAGRHREFWGDQRVSADLMSAADQTLEAFGNCVGRGLFSVDEATVLFWKAAMAISAVEAELNRIMSRTVSVAA